jgi:hypothetical protein
MVFSAPSPSEIQIETYAFLQPLMPRRANANRTIDAGDQMAQHLEIAAIVRN